MIHFMAWKKGVKSLYYCRSKSMQRAESSSSHEAQQPATGMPANDDAQKVTTTAEPIAAEANNYEECLSCQ